jgi:hypothetical protein
MTSRRPTRRFTSRNVFRKPVLSGVLLALDCISACSSASDDHPPGIVGGGGTSAAAGRPGTSGSGNGASGGGAEAGDTSSSAAGDSAAGQTSEGASDAGTGRPPPGAAVCSETAHWAGAVKVQVVSTAATELLLSLTPDELDLAFVRGGNSYVAHRAAATGSFSAGTPIPIPAGWSTAQGAALSADGKRLLVISSDQTALGEMTRLDRTSSFSNTVDQSAFSIVNQSTTYSGNIYAAPVLAPDDQQLFLSSVAPGGASTVVAATRSPGQAWTAPERVIAALDGTANARRLPTGLSADARTLFYFNEQTMREEARWRDEPKLDSPLYDMVDLGTRRGAQPNAACDHLYSVAAGDVIVEQN